MMHVMYDIVLIATHTASENLNFLKANYLKYQVIRITADLQ